ncbi:MAG: response regulator, partial [Tepidisphaeraceae bacterium]
MKSESAPNLPTRQVLLVEDEPRLREMLHRAIGEMGFIASSVNCGEAALRALAQHNFDMAVIDLNLPGIDGMELLSTMRQRWPTVQPIILTGFGDLDSAKKAIRHDVVDFLTKPCSLDLLEQALGRAYQKRLARMEIGGAPTMTESPRPVSEEPESLAEVERRHI